MTSKNVLTKTLSSLTLLSMLLLTAGPSFAQENAAAPPNKGALVDIKDSTITFTYDGRLLFRGTIRFDGSVLDRQVKIYEDGRKIQQVALLTTHSSNKKIRISTSAFESYQLHSVSQRTGIQTTCTARTLQLTSTISQSVILNHTQQIYRPGKGSNILCRLYQEKL